MRDSAIGHSHDGAYAFRGQLRKKRKKKKKQEIGAHKELNKPSKSSKRITEHNAEKQLYHKLLTHICAPVCVFV